MKGEAGDARPHIHWCGIFHCKPDWAFQTSPGGFTDLDLWCTFGGQGGLETPDGTFEVRAGDCFLLRPRTPYRGWHDPRRPLQVIALHYDYAGPGPRPALPPFHRRMIHLPLFRDLLTRAVQSHQAGRLAEADDWLQAALWEVARQDREPPDQEGREGRAARIERICERLAEDPARPFRLEEAARELHVTPGHFTRLFRAARGMTPREFAMRTRIEHAQRLLLTSSHPIKRLAEILGFSDIYHFSRQFKLRTGRSPTRFRRSGA